ncbi:hypothetical protein [Bradyrhizobium yuanmingense]|uniref:hypothetical protein n=1 Tax=Bradyrhizobium yuanmingense TaxID=108015 RepID=UPI0012E38752|nr:hypothetical protein [Bradyrhizobium yuanmingense]
MPSFLLENFGEAGFKPHGNSERFIDRAASMVKLSEHGHTIPLSTRGFEILRSLSNIAEFLRHCGQLHRDIAARFR